MELTIGTHIEHERYGEGVVGNINLVSYDIYFARGGKIEILKSSQDFDVINLAESNSNTNGFDLEAIEKIINYTLDKHSLLQEVVHLGEKWTGGKMILQPANSTLQGKEFPIETFFHKIVMLRDRLRVLEQNINSNQKLSDEEKIDMQQYITRVYGSLTSFNILFKEKDNYFVGAGGKS